MHEQLLFITGATALASAVGTLSGFGLGTVLIPLLSLFLAPIEVIFLAAIIHWFNDIFKIALFYRGTHWHLWRYYGVPAVITAVVGAAVISHESSVVMPIILGLFFIAYGVFSLLNPKFSIIPTPSKVMIGGSIAGFCAGFFGVRGAITSSFLNAFAVDKQTYLATIGMISMLIDTARIIVYRINGITLSTDLYQGLLFFIPASLLGSLAVRPIVTRMPQENYRTLVAWFILLAGIKLLLLPTTGA